MNICTFYTDEVVCIWMHMLCTIVTRAVSWLMVEYPACYWTSDLNYQYISDNSFLCGWLYATYRGLLCYITSTSVQYRLVGLNTNFDRSHVVSDCDLIVG